MKIEGIVLHHTASKGLGDGSSEWKAICTACQNRRGRNYLCDYHYGVGPTGLIFKGQDEANVCYHCGDDYLNEHTLAVSAIGNFEESVTSEPQKNSIIKLIKELIGKFGNIKIYRHKDIVNTLCPGKNYPYSYIMERVSNNSLFPDVNKNAWYNSAISEVVKRGIMKGDSEGTFRPDEYITRGELAQVVLNLINM